MNKEIYQLKIVYSDAGNRIEGMPYRIIQFHKDTNLQQLAQHVLKNFGHKVSEPFGFYSDIENWHKSAYKYELFEEDPKKHTLKNTYIDEIFDIQKQFLLIYDYLEEFRFLVIHEKCVPERPGLTYPDVIESVGEAKSKHDSQFIMDEDEVDNRFGAVKKNKEADFKDEFDDYDDDDTKGLDSIEGDTGYDENDEPLANDDDDFGFDELSEGGFDDSKSEID